MPLHVSSIYADHQEVKITLHSLWYHQTYRCDDTWLNTEIDILRCTVSKTSKFLSLFGAPLSHCLPPVVTHVVSVIVTSHCLKYIHTNVATCSKIR